MKCTHFNGRWCVYWFNNKCNYDYTDVNGCLEPTLTPFVPDFEWVWERMEREELRMSIDVMKLVERDARPNTRSSIDRAECENERFSCRLSIPFAILMYERKMRCGSVEGRERRELLPETMVNHGESSPSLPTTEERGEWV